MKGIHLHEVAGFVVKMRQKVPNLPRMPFGRVEEISQERIRSREYLKIMRSDYRRQRLISLSSWGQILGKNKDVVMWERRDVSLG